MKSPEFKDINAFLATVIIPVALVIIANGYSADLKERESIQAVALKERELQGRFVELAVDILSQIPTGEDEAIRDWATDVISKYSGVSLKEEAKENLMKNSTIIYIPSGTWSSENKAHASLWLYLTWYLDEQSVSFDDMSLWSVSRITDMDSEDMVDNKAEGAAIALNQAFLEIYQVKYKAGITQEIALKGLTNILSNGENKVPDLGFLIDGIYQFDSTTG